MGGEQHFTYFEEGQNVNEEGQCEGARPQCLRIGRASVQSGPLPWATVPVVVRRAAGGVPTLVHWGSGAAAHRSPVQVPVVGWKANAVDCLFAVSSCAL